MPLRLIQDGATVVVRVLDADFEIEVMPVLERMKFAEEIGKCGTTLEGLTALYELVASKIKRIEGWDGEPVEALKRIETAQEMQEVIKAVLNASTVSEDERKNSGSPSTSQPTADRSSAPATGAGANA
jgi:hypothetical protein